jgi:hypothetical protein
MDHASKDLYPIMSICASRLALSMARCRCQLALSAGEWVWKRISGNEDDGSGASALRILNLSPDQGNKCQKFNVVTLE